MVMKKVNIYQAKTHLSALVDRVAEGESVLICRRNRRTRRPIGLVPGFTVPVSFFEPLPAALIDAFEGR
jgi:hypothetical protein